MPTVNAITPNHRGMAADADSMQTEVVDVRLDAPLAEFNQLLRTDGLHERETGADPMILEASTQDSRNGHGPSGEIESTTQPTRTSLDGPTNATCDSQAAQQSAQPSTQGADASTQPAETQQTSLQDFLDMITMPVTGSSSLVATLAPRMRRPARQDSTTLCRSRQIANAGDQNHAVEHAQTVLMKKLGILDEHQLLTQEARGTYANLFEHPLSPSHIAALTALFGWTVPSTSVDS